MFACITFMCVTIMLVFCVCVISILDWDNMVSTLYIKNYWENRVNIIEEEVMIIGLIFVHLYIIYGEQG